MARKKSSRASKLLNEMRLNPKADWRIEQLDTVARAYDVHVRSGRGSHVVFEHSKIIYALSVPARRPIKPVYVRKFVALIEDIEGIAAAEAMLRGKHDEP